MGSQRPTASMSACGGESSVGDGARVLRRDYDAYLRVKNSYLTMCLFKSF